MRKNILPVPKIGDEIYIESAFFISRGEDDRIGGLATVREITFDISGGEEVHFISVTEIPGSRFNWEQYLAPKQEELRAQFGRNRARPDPDWSSESVQDW